MLIILQCNWSARYGDDADFLLEVYRVTPDVESVIAQRILDIEEKECCSYETFSEEEMEREKNFIADWVLNQLNPRQPGYVHPKGFDAFDDMMTQDRCWSLFKTDFANPETEE